MSALGANAARRTGHQRNGRVEFAMVTNPQVMNSLAMIPLRGAYSLNPVL